MARDDAQVDVRRTALVPDRTRPLEAEPARAVGDDRRAAGADVLPKPIRLPEVDPRSGQRPAVDGGEHDPGQDVAGADLRPPRRRAAAERAGAVVQRRRQPVAAGADAPVPAAPRPRTMRQATDASSLTT